MRIRWRQFELPTRVILDKENSTPSYGRFTAEPFERGYGITVGSSLRRVLLSSIEGAAAISLKIDGVLHEFSTIEGVYEDVTDIVLNVKQLLVRMDTHEPQVLTVGVSKKGPVTAGMLKVTDKVEVVNPDFVIATLTEDVNFNMEITVQRGRGYITAQENEAGAEKREIGLIHLDSIFSPVRRVRYNTEDTRVGHLTNYDKLLLEIWTDATITPELALVEATKIFRKHLNPFVQFFDLGREMPLEEVKEDESKKKEKFWKELQDKLDQPISSLDLSVRASNCLESENTKTIRDLVWRSESEMLKIRNFGKTSLREIKKKLSEIGLSLGLGADLLGKEEPAANAT